MKDMILFDTHCHLTDEKFDDISKIIIDANNNFVKYITIPTCNLEDAKRGIEIANKYENTYVLIGIHPEEASINKNFDKDIEELALLAKNKNVVGIGEIGLDYYWTKETKEIQKTLLIKQIELANKLDLPIALHIREATNDMLDILKQYPCKNTGIFHCCPFNEHLIKEGLKLGYYISFSGNITFKNAKPDNAINLVPLDKLLIETDSPYLTPTPFRGKTNQPKNVYYVAEKISNVKNISLAELSEITTKNAKKIYKIIDK